MLVGELSRRTGVGAHQLRYYEAQGLLEPERAANGYRHYADADVAKVRQIQRLLASGLSTSDIAWMMPCVIGEAEDFIACPELSDLLRERAQRLSAQVETLSSARDALHGFIARIDRPGATERPWNERQAASASPSPHLP